MSAGMVRRRALLVALGAAGCKSPEPAYFTLAPVPGTPTPGGPRLVELQRPGLAGYLDRPGIVRADNSYQLKVADAERWGEPLGDLIGRILSENLSQRLPGSSVFTTAGAISAPPDARIELDVQRFDADVSGSVVLLAQVAVSRGRGSPATTQTVRLSLRPLSSCDAGHCRGDEQRPWQSVGHHCGHGAWGAPDVACGSWAVTPVAEQGRDRYSPHPGGPLRPARSLPA